MHFYSLPRIILHRLSILAYFYKLYCHIFKGRTKLPNVSLQKSFKSPISICIENSSGLVWWCKKATNRPFPSCCEPHESKGKCKVFIMKIRFHSYANKTNFHMKSFALSVVFIMRFTATRKWTIRKNVQWPPVDPDLLRPTNPGISLIPIPLWWYYYLFTRPQALAHPHPQYFALVLDLGIVQAVHVCPLPVQRSNILYLWLRLLVLE